MKLHRRNLLLGALVLLVAASATSGALWSHFRLPHRFGVVEPGHLYRSGRVSPAQLAQVVEQYRIGRVISLLNPDVPESAAERAAAERLGLRWDNVPLPGDGASTPADRERLRALLVDPAAPPTLVHCAAGVYRTGLAVGMFRLHVQHWTLPQVLAELRAHKFRDEPQHANLRAALAAEAELALGVAKAAGVAETPMASE